MPKTPWIQIDINPDGDRLRVGLQSSAGQRPGTRGLDGVTRASLAALGLRVQKAAARGEKLADETREALTRLTTELFTTAVVTDRVLPDGLDPAGGRVLLRIAASEPELQAFPWEALRTQDGFLTGSTRLGMVRLPRVGEATNQFDVEVEGALRHLDRALSPVVLVPTPPPPLGRALAEEGLLPLVQGGKLDGEGLRKAVQAFVAWLAAYQAPDEPLKFVRGLLGLFPPLPPEPAGLLVRPPGTA